MSIRPKVLPNCPNAANPYHECAEYCTRKISEGKKKKPKKCFIILDANRSFGRKKKQHEYKGKPLEDLNTTFLATGRLDDGTASKLHLSSKIKAELMDAEPQYLSEQCAKEMNGHHYPLKNGHHEIPEDTSKDIMTRQSNGKPIRREDKIFRKLQSSPQMSLYPTDEDDTVVQEITGPNMSQCFDFSGVSHSLEESDEEETQSIISAPESRVLVGKYLVKANISSIVQSIFAKYGDIAANCHLESLSVRIYYLECVCFVVQELQSTELKNLTKSKVKEMFAILKDVESAEINVSWLRVILDEILKSIQLVSQQRAADVAKANCDEAYESKKKELESQMEDLAIKERAVEDAKAQIVQTRDQLRELELESSQLSDSIMSTQSKVENFQCKPLFV